MKDTKAFHQTRWCGHLEEALLGCYSEIAKGMASTMSLQNPPGASHTGHSFCLELGLCPRPRSLFD